MNARIPQRSSLWKGPALSAWILLLVPLVASRLVDGWRWPPAAFVVLGILLFGLGMAYKLLTRNQDAIAYKAAVILAIATAFLLTWGNLVQRVDSNPDAAMYFGVPIVGIVGAAFARLRPKGMAIALCATALAQASVMAVGLVMLLHRKPEVASWTGPELRGFVGNTVNALLFAGSAWLFWKAERGQPAPETT